MTTRESVEKAADSRLLQTAGRVSAVIAVPVLSLLYVLYTGRQEEKFNKLQEDITEITQSIKTVPEQIRQATESRLASAEARNERLEDKFAELSAKFTQLETKQNTESIANAEFRRDSLLRLDKLADNMGTVDKNLVELTTTLTLRRQATEEEHRQFEEFDNRVRERFFNDLGNPPAELRPKPRGN